MTPTSGKRSVFEEKKTTAGVDSEMSYASPHGSTTSSYEGESRDASTSMRTEGFAISDGNPAVNPNGTYRPFRQLPPTNPSHSTVAPPRVVTRTAYGPRSMRGLDPPAVSKSLGKVTREPKFPTDFRP